MSGIAPARGRSRVGIAAAALGGLMLATGLLFYYGVGAILRAVADASWSALAVACGLRMIPLLLRAQAWRLLLPEESGPHLRFIWARALRDGISNLFGLLPMAGEVASARCLALSSIAMQSAAASVVVDLTAETIGQVFFTAAGLAIIAIQLSASASGPWLAVGAAALLSFLSVPAMARSGRVLGLLDACGRRLSAWLSDGVAAEREAFPATVHRLFARRARVALSTALHACAWMGAGFETWAICLVAGWKLGLGDAMALEALVFALRAVAFFVPASIGVQELGYGVVGALFGLSPEVGLALSLLKRARDLLTGFPPLIAWQAAEGNRLRLIALTPAAGSGRAAVPTATYSREP